LNVSFKAHRYNFSYILYVSETWPLTLKEEHVLSVFDSRELRNLFGPKKEDAKCTGEDAR